MFEVEQRSVEVKIKAYCAENDLPEPEVKWSSIPFSGRWGIATSFFQLAAQESRLGKKVIVPQRAQEIAAAVAAYIGTPQGFDRVEAVKGYLNLYFTPGEYTQRVVDDVLANGPRFGCAEARGETVMVEYSQPNTHKAFHVGHLRNVILGIAVANILEAAGFKAVRVNYPGDVGLHVIQWMWNYLKRHAGEEAPVKDRTRWMGDLYAEAVRHYFDDPGAQDEVKDMFLRWDQQDAEMVALWRKTRQWSLDGFNEVYAILGARFDRYYFPSEMEQTGKAFVQKLIDQGLATDDRPGNPVVVKLDEYLGLKEDKYRVLVVLRSNSTSLYATWDLPLAVKKFEDYPLARSIYVIDVRQALYFQQIFKTIELMGYSWADRCYHMAYEIVNLPGNVTMSSREGTVVLFEDLVREAVRRAILIVEEKNPSLPPDLKQSIGQMVALGAIKYPMLSRDNSKVATFDWEAALDFNGQAAPYIQYAHVRANSILRKLDGEMPESLIPTYALEKTEIVLVDMISRLPKEVQRSAADLKPLYIANLAFDIAQAFNDFYNTCPVLQAEPEVRANRLRLVAAARQAIANSLGLLGIPVPEVM